MGQGDGIWSTRNTVLGWYLDTIANLLRFPLRQQEKVEAALAAVPGKTRTTSLIKWRKLQGILCSITQAVSGSRRMFTRVQHALKRVAGMHVQLTTDVHNELKGEN